MSDKDRLSVRRAGVNRVSKFSVVREDTERLLAQNPTEMLSRLLGVDVKSIERPNGTLSIWGIECPWCAKEGDEESTPTFLSSNRKKMHCASCGKSESVVYLFLETYGLSLKTDSTACAERLSVAAGVQMPTDQWSNDFVVDMGDGESTSSHATPPPTGPMPVDKREWIERELASFVARADAGELSHQEKQAVAFLMKRGIGEATIRKSELFVTVQGKKVMVVMPSFDCNGMIIGYQWFDYVDAYRSKKATYRACKKEYGSCRWPFGMKTCEGPGPVFMVCGFSDYLAALEMGFDRVISPFGVTMLSGDASHLGPVVNGKTITILFDRKEQEIQAAWRNAAALLAAGAKRVNVLIWAKGKEGFDLSDFLRGCKKRGVEDPKAFLNELVKNGGVMCVKNVRGDSPSVAQVLVDVGLLDEPEIELLRDEVTIEVTSECTSPGREGGRVEFEPDLEKAISGLGPMESFHTLIMFTDFSSRFEMCEELAVKRCKLGAGCVCVKRGKLDISDGKYSSAFFNSGRMSPAVEAINETYTFLCPKAEGWDKTKAGKAGEKKRILYKVGESSSTWRVIEARSLFSSGSKVTMVTRIPDIKTGIYEVRGFKSAHCGMTGSVFVITSMDPYRIDSLIGSMGDLPGDPTEAPFFDRVSALMETSMVGTPDMVLVAATCAWAFSPPVVPLLKDIGKHKINYRQPSMSIYVIGDPATGKTLTVQECSKAAGNQCDPTDAKMASKPGLIVSGADGSPGQMAKSIGGAMGLDEITDRKTVLEIVQLLVENRLAISMSGRHIDEVIPVRVALLSNADSARKKMHEFRSPMDAASQLIKEHLIRRIDLCVATTPIVSSVDAEARNENLHQFDHSLVVDAEELKLIGVRSWRQRPSQIRVEPEAMELLSDEADLIRRFGHVRMGNPMLYGDVCQKVFRVGCGVAGFSGSFSGEKMVVKMSHILDAILLMSECMTTMGASKEARFRMRTMDVDRAHEVLVDVSCKALSFIDSTSDTMNLIGRVIVSFIQACNAHEPGSTVETGISQAFRGNREPKTDKGTVEKRINPYKKAWNIIDRMKKAGLISSESRGSYSVTETFARSIAMMEVDNPAIYKKVIG
jgi:hypothetical protein